MVLVGLLHTGRGEWSMVVRFTRRARKWGVYVVLIALAVVLVSDVGCTRIHDITVTVEGQGSVGADGLKIAMSASTTTSSFGADYVSEGYYLRFFTDSPHRHHPVFPLGRPGSERALGTETLIQQCWP